MPRKRNPTEAEIDEPETMELRARYEEMVTYYELQIKEARRWKSWAEKRLEALPERKRGPKKGGKPKITAEHNAYALRDLYDMVQRWKYVQQRAGAIVPARKKPPGNWEDVKSPLGKMIARACDEWRYASPQTVNNLFDRNNAHAPNRVIAGVKIFKRRSDEWLSKHDDLDA